MLQYNVKRWRRKSARKYDSVTGQRQQSSRIGIFLVRSSRYDELHVEIGCLKRIDQVMKAFFGEAEYGLDDRRPLGRQIDLQPRLRRSQDGRAGARSHAPLQNEPSFSLKVAASSGCLSLPTTRLAT